MESKETFIKKPSPIEAIDGLAQVIPAGTIQKYQLLRSIWRVESSPDNSSRFEVWTGDDNVSTLGPGEAITGLMFYAEVRTGDEDVSLTFQKVAD